MTKKMGLGLLLVLMASAGSAQARSDSGCTQPLPTFLSFLSFLLPPSNCGGGGGDVKHVNAPEIDPASAMAGLTLLGAGLTVLSGRRKSK